MHKATVAKLSPEVGDVLRNNVGVDINRENIRAFFNCHRSKSSIFSLDRPGNGLVEIIVENVSF